jgi:phenylpyruvate tautomerase PptA (4-oxalocrotonate tautomerase family)
MKGGPPRKKQAFYKAIVDGLHQQLNLRPEDVFISLVEVKKENWSFRQWRGAIGSAVTGYVSGCGQGPDTRGP